jgi:hypothetical protein
VDCMFVTPPCRKEKSSLQEVTLAGLHISEGLT